MSNRVEYQSIKNTKNNTITSAKLNSIVEKMQLGRSEKFFIEKFLFSLDLITTGHDLDQTKSYSIGYWSYKTGYGYETTRKTVEKLHARGIIRIYGKAWEEYRRKDGSRSKTRYLLDINLDPKFKDFLIALSNKNYANWAFDYSIPFKAKLQIMKDRALESQKKYISGLVDNVVNSLLNSCEQVPINCVPIPHAQVPINCVRNVIPEELNSNPINRNTGGYFDQKNSIEKKLINPLLSNLFSKKVKAWDDVTNRICKELIDSGMTRIEVARKMVKQGYLKTVSDFDTKYVSLE